MEEDLLFENLGRSASLLLRFRIIGGRAGGLELRPNFSAINSPLLTLSAFDSQRRQSENRRNSLSLGDEPSTCRSGPRLSKLRPGEMSWNGRFGVLRCMTRSESVCAWVWREVFRDNVTGNVSEVIIGDDEENVLLETSVWTVTRGACSGSSIDMQLIKSFNNNRYRGHRWMIESSQSLSLRLPHRGSASCFAIKAAKSGLVAISSM